MLLYCCAVLMIVACVEKGKQGDSKQKDASLKTTYERLSEYLKNTNVPFEYDSDFSKDVTFQIDMTYDKEQVIHLSTEGTKLPYLLLAKIKAKQINKGEYKIEEMRIAVRSIDEDPRSFFTISGHPIIEKDTTEKFNYLLKADFDLRTSSRTQGQEVTIDNTMIFKSNETIDVHLNPEKLKESLIQLYNEELINKADFDFILDEIDILCCGGLICNLQVKP